jgi:HEAT repeat protein
LTVYLGYFWKTINRVKIKMTPLMKIRKSIELIILVLAAIPLLYVLNGEAKEAAPSAAQESKPLANQNLEDQIASLHKDSAYDRQRAAIALGNTGNAKALEPLIQALQDEDEFVRSFAARGLGNIRDPKAVDPLIKALGDKDLLVRRAAAQALGSIGDAKAVPALLEILEHGEVLGQRSAAEALGELKDPRALDPLIKDLRSDDIYIHGYASDALTRMGQIAIPKLAAELADPKVAPRAAEVLKELHYQPSTAQEKARYQEVLGSKASPSND